MADADPRETAKRIEEAMTPAQRSAFDRCVRRMTLRKLMLFSKRPSDDRVRGIAASCVWPCLKRIGMFRRDGTFPSKRDELRAKRKSRSQKASS